MQKGYDCQAVCDLFLKFSKGGAAVLLEAGVGLQAVLDLLPLISLWYLPHN
jgi:hypothetical protein